MSEKSPNESFLLLYTRQKCKTFARKTVKKQINARRVFSIKEPLMITPGGRREKKINFNFVFHMPNQYKM